MVAFCSQVFSYNDTITHPSLTDNIARLYNVNSSNKMNSQEIGWLKNGSVEEDLAPRWLSHFYGPQSGGGLWGFASAKDWAQGQTLQSLAIGGNQTWQKAIDAYAAGDEKTAFVALGHILHLLQDMTVPAHTRLDAHPSGDPFETWVKNQEALFIDVSNVAYLDNLNQYFDALASYSSKYFLSKDTINIDTTNLKHDLKETEKGKANCIIIELEGIKFCIVAFKQSNFGGEELFIDDPIVHSDYFNLLAPKAVSYGAGVIKLFFDEAEKKKKEEESKSWWQKLKEKTNDWFNKLSGSLYADIGVSELIKSEPAAPSEPVASEAPESSPSYSLPPDTIEARDKIVVQLPPNTVEAQEKLGGAIIEENVPSGNRVPSDIVEEKSPEQVPLPSASPSNFIPGGGGSMPSPTPTAEDASPETTIISSPASTVVTTTATFEFSSSESGSTFSCQLDNATSTSCVSPKEYTGLSESSHAFKVSATDSAGNQDATPAEHTWTIDLTPPQLSNISASAGRNSALISWTSSEAGIFQIEYGTSTSYGLTSATTTATNLTISSLSIGVAYHYRLLAQDGVDNATTSADYNFTTSTQAENVIISEIQISGATADDEFVELYNPTASDINLQGWKLARRITSATSSYSYNLLSSFPAATIPSHGYFLIAHPTGYDGAVPADQTYSSDSYYIASDNAVILYSDAGQTIVDLVGFGTASSSETATIANPAANQSVERKSCSTSTAATLFSGEHKWQGNGYDLDDNSQDFVAQANSSPQNSLMLTEPRTSWPTLMTASAWPTWQKDLNRSGQLAVSSLATSTLAVKWTATTTATHEFNSRPALDDEGNIYVGRADGLAKYSSAGVFGWLYTGGGAIYSVPLLATDRTIFFRGDWGLYALNESGQLKWKYVLSGSGGANAAIAMLSDGTLITQSSEKVYAINQDATLKWFFDPGRALQSSGSIGAFVIDSSDNIYVTIDDYIYKISSSGSLLWEKTLGNSYSSLSLGASDVLYVSAAAVWPAGGFYAINTGNGSVAWSDENGSNNLAYLAPIIDTSGIVYNILFTGGGARNLKSYNATSTPSWTAALGSSWLTAPVITNDGKIYIADQKTLKIFNAATGNLDGTFNSPNDDNFDTYFGAVGADGRIYTANSTRLYAIGN